MESGAELEKKDIVAYSAFERKNIFKRRIRMAAVTVSAIALLTILLLIVANVFFKVKTVIVDGTNKYSFSEIYALSGITEDTVIFTVNEKNVESRLKAGLPYIKSVKLKKSLPSMINIIIEEEQPLYYIAYENEYYSITDSLKVLERFPDKEKMLLRYPGLKEVAVPEIYKIITAGQLEFYDEKNQRHVSTVLVEMPDWDGFEKIVSLDLSDRFDIEVNYDNRITIDFGNKNDFGKKLNMASGILSVYSERAAGRVIVDNIEEGIAQIDDPKTGA